ncbi:hypothetical protein HCU01_01230 [Halomonas cupida]|uniref:Uncharacterized protein n=1 Tax=Halomonas cupida TaxID=44933 RepID=A0A1M7B204_9GAMM|nr:hypothetical protein [Halomonas cupida]GEN22174.1 hypothetical protein HCU01_01230 [Halomonas cupida]SHL48916.1 hypothetical protein SAMN05660971_00726 [Halomonas cupida]
MPTKRTRRSGAGASPLDQRLIGLFSCGTSCNLIDDDDQERLWRKHGERFLRHYWKQPGPCWMQRAFGEPWNDIPPHGFGHD